MFIMRKLNISSIFGIVIPLWFGLVFVSHRNFSKDQGEEHFIPKEPEISPRAFEL